MATRRRREKKRQSHRTIFLDLSEMNQRGTSGTNDKVKGCAGPITSDRPLFLAPLEKSSDPFHRARASFVVQEFTLSFGLASWIPDNRKNLVPLRTIGRPAFPREDQLFVPPPMRFNLPISRSFLTIPSLSAKFRSADLFSASSRFFLFAYSCSRKYPNVLGQVFIKCELQRSESHVGNLFETNLKILYLY